MAYSSYLQEHIQTELTKAIAEAAIKGPKDAVDFIGNYLLKIVDDDANAKKTKEIHARWEEEDKELELKRKEKESIAQKKEEEKKLNQLKDVELYAKLTEYPNKTDAMDEWCKYIQDKTNSSSVYIASLCKVKQEDQDANALLYNAVSAKDNEFLLRTTLVESETKGIVFDLLKSEQNEDEEENEENKALQDTKKERKKIHIDNVLLPNPYKERLHHFTYPKVGSFLAFESSIKSYLNDEAIQSKLRPQWPRSIEEIIAEEKAKEATETENNENDDTEQTEKDTEDAEAETEPEEEKAKEDDEEANELPADPPQIAVQYVVSMDTLGGCALYDGNAVQFVDESIAKLEDSLMKIDVKQYLKQREFEENLKAKLMEYQEKIKGEIDTKWTEIEKENESNPEPITFYRKRQYAMEATQSIWSLISNHCMKPQQSSFCRIIVAFSKLFDDDQGQKRCLINNKLSQFEEISNAAWNQCINNVKDITSEKVNGYDPTTIESFDVSLFDKLLNGIVAEEIGTEGFAILVTMLYEFVDSVCKLYNYTEEQKQKENEPVNEEEKEADAE
eukprot:169371_1